MPRLFSRKVNRLLRRGRRYALATAGAAVAGQLTLAAGITAADAIRKRRDHADRDAPAADPMSTDAVT